MRFLIRVDSGPSYGSGHLVRCLTLAAELRRRGATIELVCRDHRGHLSARVAQAGFDCTLLPEGVSTVSDDPHVVWDTDAQVADAHATRAQAERRGADWVVVDHYGLDARWENLLRAGDVKLLALDDLANRDHACDVLVDQNWYGERQAHRYDGRVPADCRCLLGPDYALLAPDYAKLRRPPAEHRAPASRVFVYFGATDATNETGKVVAALSDRVCADLNADVVIGENHAQRELLLAACAANPRISVHSPQPTLAPIMARAELAIGAGGTTSWERLCLGLPSIVVVSAFNQAEVVAALAASRAIYPMGEARDTDPQAYVRALLAHRGAPVPHEPRVDGHGARRVAELLMPSAQGSLRLRSATLLDAGLLFEWRNEPAAVSMSLNARPITWNEHVAWLDVRLESDDHQFFIAEADGLPVGQLRLDYRGDQALVSYSLDSLVRGRNWSAWLVAEALLHARRIPVNGFEALVKNENAISRKVFTRLGWVPSTHDSSVTSYRAPQHAYR
jgi:UDP-2,4-diacetamido-2,4,6-trideoxy-beta-L-altropyranose hydrolase